MRRRALDDPDEIAELVRRFYRDVAQDELLGPIFNDVARVDWAEHLPKLTAFWCRSLVGMAGYAGNPFAAHQRIHQQQRFTAEHFERWLMLFDEAVDEGWTGPDAERAKQLARTVAHAHHSQLTACTPDMAPLARSDSSRRDMAAPGPELGDLDSRTQVHDLVVGFYREVVLDDLLAPVFEEVAEVDWAEHIPRLIDYWCRILLGDQSYQGGTLLASHRHVHDQLAFRAEHFDRWFELFAAQVDRHWAGRRAREGPRSAHRRIPGPPARPGPLGTQRGSRDRQPTVTRRRRTTMSDQPADEPTASRPGSVTTTPAEAPEAWLVQLTHEAADAIVIADLDGRIRFWNPAATRVLGWSADEAVGQSLDIIIPERQRRSHWDGYRRVMASGETRYGDQLLRVPALHPDGQRRSIAFTVTLLKDADGAVTAIVAIIRDETQRWQEERELRRRLDELTTTAPAPTS